MDGLLKLKEKIIYHILQKSSYWTGYQSFEEEKTIEHCHSGWKTNQRLSEERKGKLKVEDLGPPKKTIITALDEKKVPPHL